MQHRLIMSSPDEDAGIAAGIAADPDAAPDLIEGIRTGSIQRIGRPKSAATKEAVSIPLDPDCPLRGKG